LVGVHRVGDVVDSELVVLEELSDGLGAVDVEVSGTEGAASLDVVEDASVGALPGVDVAAGAEVEVASVF
jgi:hypothetical protein